MWTVSAPYVKYKSRHGTAPLWVEHKEKEKDLVMTHCSVSSEPTNYASKWMSMSQQPFSGTFVTVFR